MKIPVPFLESDKNKTIRKSNELIEARYSLGIGEQRLVLLLASEISPNDEDFKDYEIRVADFAKMFGLESCNSLYEKVQNASDSLIGRTLQLSTDSNTSRKTTWLSYVEYVKGSGIVKLRFDKSLKPYLLQLKGHFTQYQLNHVIDFKSQYSMRLYELLKMDAFKANKNRLFEKTFEVFELRVFFGIDKNDYPLFANFKQKVIQPATREISDKTDLHINDVKYGKTRRKITNITFVVAIRSEDEKKRQQADLQIENKTPEKENKNHPIIESLVSLGFSIEIAKTYKNKHGVKKIERNIAYTLAKKEAGLVKDVPAYLNMAIENDYGGGVWETENQKKAQAQANKAQLEKEQLAKKAQEAKNIADKKAQSQQAFDRFLVLPQEQQEELRNQFMSMTDSIVKGKIQAALKAGEPFYTSPAVLQNFKYFIVSNKLV